MLIYASSYEAERSSRPAEPEALKSAVRPARVLVVEDERHIARLLEFVLGKAGYEVRSCPSAEDALLQVEGLKPDALVLDMVLPGMSGAEFLRVVRAAPYLCNCVVIVLSSQWFAQSEDKLAELGTVTICTKPIAPSTLLRKLDELGVRVAVPLDK